MKVINVQDAKTHLSRLLEQVSDGKVFLLGKHGRPMAKLVKYAPEHEERLLGGFEGQIRIADDFDDEDPAITASFGGSGA